MPAFHNYDFYDNADLVGLYYQIVVGHTVANVSSSVCFVVGAARSRACVHACVRAEASRGGCSDETALSVDWPSLGRDRSLPSGAPQMLRPADAIVLSCGMWLALPHRYRQDVVATG